MNRIRVLPLDIQQYIANFMYIPKFAYMGELENHFGYENVTITINTNLKNKVVGTHQPYFVRRTKQIIQFKAFEFDTTRVLHRIRVHRDIAQRIGCR